jgi:GT2 family glycosyltransferase
VKFLQENFPKVKIIKLNKNMGYSVAINSGLEQSTSKYAVVLNNDTTVEPNWLIELVLVAESDQRIGSCQPKILSQSDPTVIDAVGLWINKDGGTWQEGCQIKDKGQYEKIKEVLGACSASVLYLRRALSQIGMFDSDFFVLYDDVDVALRLKLAGWKCMYVPSAIVYHIGSASVRVNSPFRTYLLQRNNYFYRMKNLPKGILLEFLIQRLIFIPLDTFLYCIKERELIIPYLKGNFDGIKGFAKMYKKRPKTLFFP